MAQAMRFCADAPCFCRPCFLNLLWYSFIYPCAGSIFTPLTATLSTVNPVLIVAVIYVGYLYGMQSIFQVLRLNRYQNTQTHHSSAAAVPSLLSGPDQSIPASVLQRGSEPAVPVPPPETVSEPVSRLGMDANVPASPLV